MIPVRFSGPGRIITPFLTLTPGTRLGRYEILAAIGAGGAPSLVRRGLSGASTKKARRLWDGPRLAAVGSGRASVVCWRGPAARPRSQSGAGDDRQAFG